MDSLDVSKVFFEALNYPQFARPNFYVIMQEQSGWGRGVYLTALNEVYHSAVMHLRVHFNADKRTKPHLKFEDISLPVKRLTGGEETGDFNKKILDELHLAVEAADLSGREKKIFTPIEILSLSEYGLWFIRKEFREESKKYSTDPIHYNSYNIYLIAQDAPFFSVQQFKLAFRELLLNAPNKESLKRMMRGYYNAAVEIVILWNTKISLIENEAHKGDDSKRPETVRLQFNAVDMNYSRWSDDKAFELYNPRPYHNQNFASFAAGIANLLASELLGSKEVSIKTTEDDFRIHFVKGIQDLLTKDTEPGFITDAKKGKRNEAAFRSWFASWLAAKDYKAYSEPIKGNGRMDLLVDHPDLGRRVMEFKGWWNRDKKLIIQQVDKYLTQFEGEAYIVMINNTRKSIVARYKKKIMTKSMGYIPGTWEPVENKPTAFVYYRSSHKLGAEIKVVYHFLISLY